MDQDGIPQDQPYPRQPGQFPGQPASPQQWGYAYPENSQAVTALTLGLVGLVFCAIAAPFAWSIGNKELEAIDAGRRDPSKRDLANAGRILGIIGCVLAVLSIVVGVIFIVFFGFLGVVGSTTG